MFNNSTLNFSSDPKILYPYYSKILWTTAYSLQFFVAMIGNFLIVWIVYRDNRLKTTTNYLIANMAASDLIGGLIIYAYKIAFVQSDNEWLIGGEVGNTLCKITKFTIDLSLNVSGNSCIAIAIDRYFAVVHPFKRPFKGKMKHVIAAIWITSAVFSSPYLYLFATIEEGGRLFCKVSGKKWFLYLHFAYVEAAFEGLLSAVFITVTYTFTIYKLFFRHKVPGLSTFELRRRDQQKKKGLKHAVTIVVLLYLCRIVLITVVFLHLQGKLYHHSLLQRTALFEVSFFILCFSLVYNFFVYLIFNDVYRENIKALISKCCRRSNANRRQEIPAEREMIEMQALN